MPRPPSQSQYFISHKAGSLPTKQFPTSNSSYGEHHFQAVPTHRPQRGPQPRELATNPFPLARLESSTPADLFLGQKNHASPSESGSGYTKRGVLPEDPRKTLSAPGPVPAQPRRPTLTSSPPPPPSLTGAPAPRAVAAPPHPASRLRPLPARRWRLVAPRYSSSSGPPRPRCPAWR